MEEVEQVITLKPKNPNKLFKLWLKEWSDEAEKKKRTNNAYSKALHTLNKYPLTLFTGHDCAILENFGPKICQMLDDRLVIHLRTVDSKSHGNHLNRY